MFLLVSYVFLAVPAFFLDMSSIFLIMIKRFHSMIRGHMFIAEELRCTPYSLDARSSTERSEDDIQYGVSYLCVPIMELQQPRTRPKSAPELSLEMQRLEYLSARVDTLPMLSEASFQGYL